MRQTYPSGAVGRVTMRTVVLLIALIAIFISTSVANLTASVRAGQSTGTTPQVVAPSTTPLKAVVIVGPTDWQTDQYLEWGENIALAAEANGMEVARIYHPNALWSTVVQETTGANLVVYLGHGNGWPSPYAPYQENTKDGFGLNYPDPTQRDEWDTKYYGANKIREDLHLAPNAIVILNHACYAGGHGEDTMATPSQSIAIQRADNFAAGFLAVGARTVFALTFQPAQEIVNSLFSDHDTMEGLFQKRFNPWGNGDTDPYYGWVGWNPTYHDSVRTPGAQLLLDPHPSKSYRRALSGDFTMTTDQWSGSADPSDVTAPEVTSLEGVPSSGTVGPSEAAAPIFTPNGDGLSDTLSIKSTVSEPAYLDFKVRDESGAVVRSFSTWSEAGDSTSTWSGKSDAGAWVPEGRYDIEVKPRDVAGNIGEVATTRVKVLKAMKSPTGAPSFLFARDGDALASTSAMSVTMTSVASLDWKITNTAGDTVRSFMSAQTVSPGLLAQAWDGKDDAGAYVPDGMYWQVLTATTDAGTYSHMLSIRVMPFKVTAPQWSGPAGTKVTFSVISAESLTGYAVIWVYQPGVERYRISPVRASATKFKFTVTFKPGTAGQVAIKISGKDIAGGKNNQTVDFTLQ